MFSKTEGSGSSRERGRRKQVEQRVVEVAEQSRNRESKTKQGRQQDDRGSSRWAVETAGRAVEQQTKLGRQRHDRVKQG